MPKNILIVDDDVDIINALKLRLEADDYKVATALDGEEGFKKAKSEKPDLILLDAVMPKKDGWTFVREMKKDDSIKRIPVIVLTGKDSLEDEFRLEGLKDFITKPFEAEALIMKIKTHLSDMSAWSNAEQNTSPSKRRSARHTTKTTPITGNSRFRQ